MKKWFAGVAATVISGVIVFWLTQGISEKPPEPEPPVSIDSFTGSWMNKNARNGDLASVRVTKRSSALGDIQVGRWGNLGVQDLGSTEAIFENNKLKSGIYFLDSVRRLQLTLIAPKEDTLDTIVEHMVVGQGGTRTEVKQYVLNRSRH